tara:strand:+ start:881 stop:1117 length:237 start_codon:yes stop_codon:yes gene_type:complete
MKKFISIFLALIISLFIDSQIANALEDILITEENTQIEGTNSNKVDVDSSKSSSNKDDIFGDEQTFPFVAGLGKNAAH